MDENGFKIGVVGVGLIGGSICKALSENKSNVIYGIDLDEEVLKAATKDGAIKSGFTDPDQIISELDIIILCIYEKGIYKFLESNKDKFKQGAIITDTFGLKQQIMNNIKEILPEGVTFIGGHPMAGKESSGYLQSDKNIFNNANYIITTDLDNEDENLLKLLACLKDLGNIRIILADPKEHDRMIALTSHLPHIIASSLVMVSKDEEKAGDFIGGSFKDTSRTADINDVLWTDLFMSNKNDVIEQLEKFKSNLDAFKDAILRNNEDEIRSLLIDGRETLKTIKNKR